MGRALSWSLAAHAAFIISFLLLSATRQPLTIPQIVRPVRLVTYLEPGAAPRQKTSALIAPEAARAIPVPAEPRVIQPPAAPIHAPTAAASAPVAVPRVAVPVREKAPPASRLPLPLPETRPDLSERLARRLATTAAENRPVEVAAPQIVRLPPVETVAITPSPEQTVPGNPAAAPGIVVPIGYFPHAWYLAVLKEKVYSRWSPPSEFFQSSRPPAALVEFRIDRSGRISVIALKESSGSARFDKSALAAIQSLGQVPALPEQYREENLDVVIRFQNQK